VAQVAKLDFLFSMNNFKRIKVEILNYVEIYKIEF